MTFKKLDSLLGAHRKAITLSQNGIFNIYSLGTQTSRVARREGIKQLLSEGLEGWCMHACTEKEWVLETLEAIHSHHD